MGNKILQIANRIKEARIAAELSQKELAEKLNIAQTRLSNWEIGTSRPLADNIFLLAETLNVSSDYLLGLIDSYFPIQQNDKHYLSPVCQKLYQACNKLTDDEQNRLLGYAQAILENSENKKGLEIVENSSKQAG